MKKIHISFFQISLFVLLMLNFSGLYAQKTRQNNLTEPSTVFISGRLTTFGSGLFNVTLNISGSATGTVQSDSEGNYRFDNLPDAGTYTITPSDPDYIFNPPSRTVTTSGTILFDINFTALERCSTPNCRTNGKIAFVRNGDIYTAFQNGSNLVSLTGSGVNSNPAYSPDGDKIAYVSTVNGNSEIYIMNEDSSNPVRVTNNPATDIYPSFSPDGTKIVFISTRDGFNEIYTMNTDGSNVVRLTTDHIDKAAPKFSPDGSKIVFSKKLALQRESIFTMNADGSNQLQLTNLEFGLDQSPSYSPNGQFIVFSRYDFGNFYSPIFRMNNDGSNQTRITSFSDRNSNPSYSPNGKKLIYGVFIAGPPSFYNIYVDSQATGTSGAGVSNAQQPIWQPLRSPAVIRRPFDFDGDGKADIGVYRGGNWYIQRSAQGFTGVSFGVTSDKLVPADYDGDGKTDIAVFRRNANSAWYILQSADNTFRAVNWGVPNEAQAIVFDTPVPADYDGDGKADIAVFRKTDDLSAPTNFLILQSSNNAPRFEQWGAAFDTPVPADFDGDGKTDLAVFRGGNWYINQSTQGFRAVPFGISTDKLITADFDGDGKADIGVWRPSDRTWYILQSQGIYKVLTFGLPTDLPVAADYDGDGKADIGVFRPSDGTWYLVKSNTGFAAQSFGANGDAPIPNAFVP